jgi:hypothetical protein
MSRVVRSCALVGLVAAAVATSVVAPAGASTAPTTRTSATAATRPVAASTGARGLPTLRLGSSGPYVVAVQRMLALPRTGRYDAGTMAAVKRVQAWKKIAPANGVVTIVTWAAISDPTLAAKMVASPSARRTVSLAAWQSSVHGYGISYRESKRSCTAVSPSGLYRGRWQMSSTLWRAYGGLAFAPVANKASCLQQDTVAFTVWKSNGWKPWGG